MEAYAPVPVLDAFDRSRGCLESVIATLADPAADGQTHAELEDYLTACSRELMRTLLQEHLDLRAEREERQEVVCGADGVRRTHVEREHGRGLITLFGQVRVARQAYRGRGVRNVYPADAELNLPREAHSHGLRRLAALESARGSFADAGDAIERAVGVRVGHRQVEQLAQAASVDIDAFYAARRPEAAGAEALLVMQVDGKGVVMRPEALRPATAKAAAEATPKLATRTCRGEKRSRKRMAEVGAVYDAAPVVRTADQVITLGTGQDHVKGPKAEGKWLTASVERDADEVISAVFDEAERRDPQHLRTRVVLVDGNNYQIQQVKAEAAARQVSIHLLVDFIHVLEYLWKAAWCFFAEGAKAAEQWVADHARRILAGRTDLVIAAIRRKTTCRDPVPDKRARIQECVRYLCNKKPYLHYDQALQQGWPIATGVIEGACRHLVKDRMDITGARWGLTGAEAVLKLRTVVSNGEFDDYWAFHLQQEHHRVHGAQHPGNDAPTT